MRTIDDILTEIEDRLEAAQVVLASGQSVQAFQCVKRFDSTDLTAAFVELLVTEQRVALVVYTGERYEDDASGPDQISFRRVVEVSVIASDRVLGKRREAVFGSEKTPGAIRLRDTARDSLMGQLLADVAGESEAIDCLPINGDLISLEDLAKKQPGRVAAILDLECRDRNAVPAPSSED